MMIWLQVIYVKVPKIKMFKRTYNEKSIQLPHLYFSYPIPFPAGKQNKHVFT